MLNSPDLFPESINRKVISASRRTDMIATDPLGLACVLKEKALPAETHTLVLWTKNPFHILYHAALFEQLKKYDQCFLFLSITGLGGTILEPNVPRAEKVLSYLPDLVDFFGSSERIQIRFDPVVHFQLSDGSTINNLNFFEQLAPHVQQQNIKRITTSWVQIYGKVAKRLAAKGITPMTLSPKQWADESAWLQKMAQKNKLILQGCCVAGWPRSKCIDGDLFNHLHPLGYKTTTTRAKGQRRLCGCTKSLDVGWYNTCVHGCLYCYGNPKLEK